MKIHLMKPFKCKVLLLKVFEPLKRESNQMKFSKEIKCDFSYYYYNYYYFSGPSSFSQIEHVSLLLVQELSAPATAEKNALKANDFSGK